MKDYRAIQPELKDYKLNKHKNFPLYSFVFSLFQRNHLPTHRNARQNIKQGYIYIYPAFIQTWRSQSLINKHEEDKAGANICDIDDFSLSHSLTFQKFFQKEDIPADRMQREYSSNTWNNY